MIDFYNINVVLVKSEYNEISDFFIAQLVSWVKSSSISAPIVSTLNSPLDKYSNEGKTPPFSYKIDFILRQISEVFQNDPIKKHHTMSLFLTLSH